MRQSGLLFLAILFQTSIGSGQVLRLPEAANQLSATVVLDSAAKDTASGLYTYRYSVSNASSSRQELWMFTLGLVGDAARTIINATAPKGWEFAKHAGDGMVSWAATEVDSDPDEDDGDVIASPYQIKPGQTLTGFSFQSPSPPSSIKVYSQGFTKLPVAVDAGDLTDTGLTLKNPLDDSIIGVTQGPAPSDPTQQPSQFGLFTITKLINEAVIQLPLRFGVHFNDTAGAFSRQDLIVVLNGEDITALLKPDPQDSSSLLAEFLIQDAPLVDGTNYVKAMLRGTPVNSTISTADYNSLRFYLNSPRSLDLNGDGGINCLDLAIVRASFGRSMGQNGFDPRADVNGDGVINVKDLSLVSRAIDNSIVCNQ